jgi:putative CocE/NonD family hydrolase
MRRHAALFACACALAATAAASAQAATVSEHGYFAARDGTRLRYSVIRPDDKAKHPVLVNYEGYAAGSDPADNGVSTFEQRILDRGYALVGVSVRGTGCSQGVFDPFAPTMGQDGADAIEWTAKQGWADGRVGMIGVSFGGITQLLTAAQRPAHLKAIAPSSALSDLYRDVAYPGGVLEYDFPFAWTAIQKEGGTAYTLTGAPRDGDGECVQNHVTHEVGNTGGENLIPALILNNPYFDDSGKWITRAPSAGFPKIEVPTYLHNAWQDEQLPGRIYESLGLFAHAAKVWADFTNGNHGRDYYQASAEQRTLDFLDRFVRGADTGFDKKVPHLTIGLETKLADNEPTWRITGDKLEPKVQPRALSLRTAGALTDAPAAGGEAPDTYGYPLPSSDVLEPGPAQSGYSTGQLAWKAPVPPGGAVAYTTAPLGRDLVVAGPASLDLWLASTGTDTDVQTTITEVRPDGQETYVQRGWLRASHRKLDAKRSTAVRPYQTHLRADAQPLTANEPTAMRVEVFPFAHAFRKGSRLRVWIEAPTGHTGFWAFTPTGGSGQNSVLHDPAHPSRLVLGELAGETAHSPLPACDTLRNQPCRADPLSAGS